MVLVPRDRLIGFAYDFVREQSAGEWGDNLIAKDAEKLIAGLEALSASPVREGMGASASELERVLSACDHMEAATVKMGGRADDAEIPVNTQWLRRVCAALSAPSTTSTAEQVGEPLDKVIEDCWQRLLDTDDRTSPEDMLLIRHDELASFMREAAASSPNPPGEGEEPVAWRVRNHPHNGWIYTGLGGRHDGCEVEPLFTRPTPATPEGPSFLGHLVETGGQTDFVPAGREIVLMRGRGKATPVYDGPQNVTATPEGLRARERLLKLADEWKDASYWTTGGTPASDKLEVDHGKRRIAADILAALQPQAQGGE